MECTYLENGFVQGALPGQGTAILLTKERHTALLAVAGAAEKLLLENCRSIEAEEIDHLQCMVIDSTKFIAFHLILWEGLLQLGRGNFEKAAHCFEDVLANGYNQWRIYKYLAEAVEGGKRAC